MPALQHLATVKGYRFIGCNSNGNNAYFVRKEYASHPAIVKLETGFQPASFAEYAVEGERVRGSRVLDVIRGLPVYNLLTGQIEAL